MLTQDKVLWPVMYQSTSVYAARVENSVNRVNGSVNLRSIVGNKMAASVGQSHGEPLSTAALGDGLLCRKGKGTGLPGTLPAQGSSFGVSQSMTPFSSDRDVASASLRVKKKVEPLPRPSLSAQIFPPHRSTIRLQIGSPSPEESRSCREGSAL